MSSDSFTDNQRKSDYLILKLKKEGSINNEL